MRQGDVLTELLLELLDLLAQDDGHDLGLLGLIRMVATGVGAWVAGWAARSDGELQLAVKGEMPTWMPSL